ncbi:MAG: rhodanese-like domain-containing protein, partial [Dehalococcoidia bacterium]
MAEYVHPETLVSTQWVADNLNDPKVRLVEVDVDTAAYDTGHIPGAAGWNWKQDLETGVERNIASKEQIEEL